MALPKPFDFSASKKDIIELDLSPDIQVASLEQPFPAIELKPEMSKRRSAILKLFPRANAIKKKTAQSKENPYDFIEIQDQPLTKLEDNNLDVAVKAYIHDRIATVVSREELYKEVFDTAMYMLQEIGIQIYIREKVGEVHKELNVYLTPSLKELLNSPYSALTTDTNKAELLDEFIEAVEEFCNEIENNFRITGLNRFKAAAIWFRWWMNNSMVANTTVYCAPFMIGMYLAFSVGVWYGVCAETMYLMPFAYECLKYGKMSQSDLELIRKDTLRKIDYAKLQLEKPTYRPVASVRDFMASLSNQEVLDQFKPQLKELLSYVKDTIILEMFKEEKGEESMLQKELVAELRTDMHFVTQMNEHIDATLDTESFHLFNGGPRQPYLDRWRELSNEIKQFS